MKSIQIFTLIVGSMCVLVGALLFTAFLFPDVATEFGIGSDGGMTSMLIIFLMFCVLFAISARQMNRE